MTAALSATVYAVDVDRSARFHASVVGWSVAESVAGDFAIRPGDAGWSWRGQLHCDGHDPEGNVFQVRVPAAG